MTNRVGSRRLVRLTPWHYVPKQTGTWDLRFDPVGGMAVQSLVIARNAAAHGWTEEVLTLGLPGTPRRWSNAPGSTSVRTRVPMPRIRNNHSGSYALVESWAAAAYREARRAARSGACDHIHVHLDGTVAALLAADALINLRRVPVTVTVNCFRAAEYQSPVLCAASVSKAAARLQDRVIRRADGVVVLTDARREEVERQTSRRDIVVIPDALASVPESSLDPAARRHARDLLSVASDAEVVGFVGRLSWEKGWRHFLTVAGELHRSRGTLPVILGGGLQEAEARAAAESLGLGDILVITGYMERRDLVTRIPALDIVLVPSQHEEHGVAAIEVQAAGVPVVAYAVGGLPEVVHHPGSLVDPGDVQSMSRAAAQAFSATERDRANLRAHASNLFEESEVMARFFAFLNSKNK
ncbi:MAG: glycosyltransferase [Mycobacterium sp.]